jgi:hypothetical protein
MAASSFQTSAAQSKFNLNTMIKYAEDGSQAGKLKDNIPTNQLQ